MLDKIFERRFLSVILTAAITVTLMASCGSASKIDQYQVYLEEGEYARAAEIHESLADTEEDNEDIERSLALHLLTLQASVQSQSLSFDAYTQTLNTMASFQLSNDNSLIQAAVDVLLVEESALELIENARRSAKTNNWVEAISLMNQARPFSTTTAELRQLFMTIRSSYKQDIISRVESLEAQDSLEAAAMLLAEATEALPNDNDLAVRLKQVENLRFTKERTDLIMNVTNLRSQDAWGPALDAIKTASPAVQEDVEVSALRDQIQLQYEEDLLLNLEALEAEGALEAALAQVKLDLQIFPDSLRLQWKLRIYEAIAAADSQS